MSTRAELKRAYKETEPEAGIYQIKNTVNDKVLLGSSTNLHGPLGRHRFMLKYGSHQNQVLQREWKQFGEAAFIFEVLEVVKRTDDPTFSLEHSLSDLEQRWLQQVQPFGDRGYNTGPNIRD
jgi:group I intron endonuclease